MTNSPVRYLRRTVWEDLTPEQIADRYAAGASLDDIGIVTGTGVHRVRAVLVEAGVTIRPAIGGRCSNPNKYLRKP